MKPYLIPLLLLTLCFSLTTRAETARDTTIIEFTDTAVNKRVTIISTGNKEISLPVNLTLNSVLKAMGIDTTERERAVILVDKAEDKRDTLLFISQDGHRIQIISKGDLGQRPPQRKFYGETDYGEDITDQAPGEWADKTWESKKENRETPVQKKSRFFSKSDFGVYLGLNTLANDQNGPFTSSDLRTWPSRYIALSLRKNATLLRGVGADLALSYGPEVVWYNFMFQNSNTVALENNVPVYTVAGFHTDKSKLVVPALNLPVMLNLGIKKEKFKIGAGGYVGYRFGGYTKTEDLNGNKEKIKGDYHLSQLLYGLTAELGRRNGFTIFVRYDLNTLFDDQTLRANALSFGIRL